MSEYNFTTRVRQVLSQARTEAVNLRHEYVGTEHMLLALLADAGGIGPAMLHELRADIDEVRAKVLETVKKGKGNASVSEVAYTSRAKKVLELAMQEARELESGAVSTGHVLIALAREGKGIAGQVLEDSGCSDAALRDAFLILSRSGKFDEPELVSSSSSYVLGGNFLTQLQDILRGQNPGLDRLAFVGDLDLLPTEITVELLAALDLLHRAWGGGGLSIENLKVGTTAYSRELAV